MKTDEANSFFSFNTISDAIEHENTRKKSPQKCCSYFFPMTNELKCFYSNSFSKYMKNDEKKSIDWKINVKNGYHYHHRRHHHHQSALFVVVVVDVNSIDVKVMKINFLENMCAVFFQFSLPFSFPLYLLFSLFLSHPFFVSQFR